MITYIDRLKTPYLWRRANRAHADTGKAPISLRIEIDGYARAELSTGVSATAEEWSQEGQRKVPPRGMSKAERALLDQDNTRLAELVGIVRQGYHNFKSQGGNPSPADLRHLLRVGKSKDERDKSFAAALETLRKDLASPSKGRKPRTLEGDTDHILWLLMYMFQTKQLNLLAEDVTKPWLTGFERWAIARGLGGMNIRKVIGKAQNALLLAEQEGLVKASTLHGYKFISRLATPKKRRLTEEELGRLSVFPYGPKLQPIADMFLFMCYTGLSYVDYTRFAKTPEQFFKRYPHPATKEQVLGIEMTRQKLEYTGKIFWVPLFPEARSLLQKYGYQLPCYSKPYANAQLKEVAKLIGVSIGTLSNKDARSTFSQLMRDRFGGEVAAAMTGHNQATMNANYSSVSPKQIMSVLGLALGDN